MPVVLSLDFDVSLFLFYSFVLLLLFVFGLCELLELLFEGKKKIMSGLFNILLFVLLVDYDSFNVIVDHFLLDFRNIFACVIFVLLFL